MGVLFYDFDGNAFGYEEIHNVLAEVGVSDCETLFVHSDVVFGRPGEAFNKKNYLTTLWEILESFNVKHIIVPTFTYSFCNNENYLWIRI